VQNPYTTKAQSTKPLVLSRKQLSVDPFTKKPRVTRAIHVNSLTPVEPREAGPRERARRLKQQLRVASNQLGVGMESEMVAEYLRTSKVYQTRKARG